MSEAAVEAAETTIGAAIRRAIEEALIGDDRVFVLGEDIEHMGLFAGLHKTFGTERVRETPISESAIIGASVGAALGGMRPIAEIMIMDFLSVCMDQLANMAAKLRYTTAGRTNVPMTVRVVSYGGGGFGSGSTHSQSLEAWLMHVPGLKIVYPSSPVDAYGLMASCIEDDDPCVFVESPGLYGVKGPAADHGHRVPLGRASVRRDGTDVTLVGYGRTVLDALAVADRLASEGISVEVLDLRSLVPLDVDTILTSAQKTGRVVVSHLAVEFAGPGAEIAAIVSERLFGRLRAPVRRLGGRYTPIPASRDLEPHWYPSVETTAAAVRAVMGA
jgi:acetoin:2,6-dichlorophenolindophenol oxidoreductase subunit beta